MTKQRFHAMLFVVLVAALLLANWNFRSRLFVARQQAEEAMANLSECNRLARDIRQARSAQSDSESRASSTQDLYRLAAASLVDGGLGSDRLSQVSPIGDRSDREASLVFDGLDLASTVSVLARLLESDHALTVTRARLARTARNRSAGAWRMTLDVQY